MRRKQEISTVSPADSHNERVQQELLRTLVTKLTHLTSRPQHWINFSVALCLELPTCQHEMREGATLAPSVIDTLPLKRSESAPASHKPYIVSPSMYTAPSMVTNMKRSTCVWKRAREISRYSQIFSSSSVRGFGTACVPVVGVDAGAIWCFHKPPSCNGVVTSLSLTFFERRWDGDMTL